MGGAAHNDTVNYIYNTLTALGDYYDVQKQEWSSLIQTEGNATFSANDVPLQADVLSYSPSGDVTAPLVLVNNLGCDAVSLNSWFVQLVLTDVQV